MTSRARTSEKSTLGMSDVRSLTGAQFEGALAELVARAPRRRNTTCYACDRCERCSQCTFCVGSTGLARCHYCTSCTDSVECSHCVRCQTCWACQHCVESESCLASAYLVRSIGCIECTYGFGCVGLSGRDFCILNEPYDRSSYFEAVARLARELRIALP